MLIDTPRLEPPMTRRRAKLEPRAEPTQLVQQVVEPVIEQYCRMTRNRTKSLTGKSHTNEEKAKPKTLSPELQLEPDVDTKRKRTDSNQESNIQKRRKVEEEEAMQLQETIPEPSIEPVHRTLRIRLQMPKSCGPQRRF